MKKCFLWCRVSSAEQRDEGWSLDEQKERLTTYATNKDFSIARTYVVTETASKQFQRAQFQEMLADAKRERPAAILVMKLDRAVRNLPDYVALETLEREQNIQLISITQHTENTPAGRTPTWRHSSPINFPTT
jgi:site-specific DNA recombinase